MSLIQVHFIHDLQTFEWITWWWWWEEVADISIRAENWFNCKSFHIIQIQFPFEYFKKLIFQVHSLCLFFLCCNLQTILLFRAMNRSNFMRELSKFAWLQRLCRRTIISEAKYHKNGKSLEVAQASKIFNAPTLTQNVTEYQLLTISFAYRLMSVLNIQVFYFFVCAALVMALAHMINFFNDVTAVIFSDAIMGRIYWF